MASLSLDYAWPYEFKTNNLDNSSSDCGIVNSSELIIAYCVTKIDS